MLEYDFQQRKAELEVTKRVLARPVETTGGGS
jgi:hypothetical protein